MLPWASVCVVNVYVLAKSVFGRFPYLDFHQARCSMMEWDQTRLDSGYLEPDQMFERPNCTITIFVLQCYI